MPDRIQRLDRLPAAAARVNVMSQFIQHRCQFAADARRASRDENHLGILHTKLLVIVL